MTAVVRTKSGCPSEAVMTDPLNIQKLRRIATAIKKEINVDVSARTLAEISYKLQLFLEVNSLRYQ